MRERNRYPTEAGKALDLLNPPSAWKTLFDSIKACSRCGRRKSVKVRTIDWAFWIVQCDNCWSQTPLTIHESPSVAIDAWNAGNVYVPPPPPRRHYHKCRSMGVSERVRRWLGIARR